MQNREKILYQATSSPKQFLRNSSFLPFPNSENILSRRGWGIKVEEDDKEEGCVCVCVGGGGGGGGGAGWSGV